MRTLLPIALLSLILQDPAPPAAAPRADPKYEALVRDIGKCAVIPEGPLRLEAYDALAKKLGVGPKPVDGMGKWNVKVAVNPLDDTRTVTANLEADTESTLRLKGGQLPELVVRCKQGVIDAYAISGVRAEKEEKEGKATVSLRYDKELAIDVVMDQSTDGEALFWPDAAAAAKKMASAERLIFVFTPAGAAPALLQFDLRGFALVHRQLLEACPEGK
jgi:hypothetical protein